MKRDAILWMLLIAGAAIWFLSFGANFALAPWACTLRWKPSLYVISAVALALTAGSGLAAWRNFQEMGRDSPGEASGPAAAARSLALGAVLLNAMFFLVILAQAIPEIILGACE